MKGKGTHRHSLKGKETVNGSETRIRVILRDEGPVGDHSLQ
jgi:hypothetical protein